MEVLTLSNICTAARIHFTRASWDSHNQLSFWSSYQWPKQLNPSWAAWTIWRDALQAVFLWRLNDKCPCAPLGHWRQALDPDWHWYRDTEENRVYTRNGKEWENWYHVTQARGRPKYRLIESTPNFPSATAWVSGYHNHNGTLLTVKSEALLDPTTIVTQVTPSNAAQAILQLPPVD
jgi:hypothetical protein